MPDSAHLFTPLNDTLEERIRTYRSVFSAYQNAEASLKLMDDKNWSDSLGEREEVEQAYSIIEHSLFLATRSIEQSDVNNANEQCLMSDDELKEFIQLKRQLEIQGVRLSRLASSSNKFVTTQRK